eukprot:jgi/Hompol1/697/HPOL_002588-RA
MDKTSQLSRIELSSEIHMLCSSYALSTGNEEVALVLLGTYGTQGQNEDEQKKDAGDLLDSAADKVAVVQSCVFVVRHDKRRDRVEISSSELSRALGEAEAAGLRVVGWCHSHPHITVHPSHVDLATQHSLQALDPRFFGIIYAAFLSPSNTTSRLQVTAFQAARSSSSGSLVEVRVPLSIRPSHNLGLLSANRFNKLIQIPMRLYEEVAAQESPTTSSSSSSSHQASNEALQPIDTILRVNAISQKVVLLQDKFIVPLLELFTQRSSTSSSSLHPSC